MAAGCEGAALPGDDAAVRATAAGMGAMDAGGAMDAAVMVAGWATVQAWSAEALPGAAAAVEVPDVKAADAVAEATVGDGAWEVSVLLLLLSVSAWTWTMACLKAPAAGAAAGLTASVADGCLGGGIHAPAGCGAAASAPVSGLGSSTAAVALLRAAAALVGRCCARVSSC